MRILFWIYGDKVYVRGVLSEDNTSSNYTHFNMTGKIAASGNCNTLWNYEDINAPLRIFCGCYMFDYCRALTTAPELPATALAMGCYIGMFDYCESLTTAPELPATELAESCYDSMFQNCTSLTSAPELPATTLMNYCYRQMFYGCTSLTTAPELPATTLSNSCYNSMFQNCTSLNHITCLATDISVSNCTNYWVSRVSSTGTFVKYPSMNNWTTGTSGIPSGWTVVDAEV